MTSDAMAMPQLRASRRKGRTRKRLEAVLHEPAWPSVTLAVRRMAGRALEALLPPPRPGEGTRRVLFACADNAGRSQMATAFFNHLADPARARAIAAATREPREVEPEVARAMEEVGVPLSAVLPRRLTAPLALAAGHLVTLGCGGDLPFFGGVRVEEWRLRDPSGQTPERVRAIRDEVRRRVEAMVDAHGWRRTEATDR
jgi:arsenate reductase